MGNRNLEQSSNIKALCETVREGNWNVQCCLKHMTQKLWRKPVFLGGMNGSEWVKRNNHPSLLCWNVDKVMLTCLFKRSDLNSALSSFIVTTVQFTAGALAHSLWQKKSIVWLEHPSYLSDFAISKNKVWLEGANLQHSIDVQRKVMTLLKGIQKRCSVTFSNIGNITR